MVRQEQPKKLRKKKESVPKGIVLTYEEKGYMKLLYGRPTSWLTLYCPTIQNMMDKKLIDFDKSKGDNTRMIKLSRLGNELYERTIETKDRV